MDGAPLSGRGRRAGRNSVGRSDPLQSQGGRGVCFVHRAMTSIGNRPMCWFVYLCMFVRVCVRYVRVYSEDSPDDTESSTERAATAPRPLHWRRPGRRLQPCQGDRVCGDQTAAAVVTGCRLVPPITTPAPRAPLTSHPEARLARHPPPPQSARRDAVCICCSLVRDRISRGEAAALIGTQTD